MTSVSGLEKGAHHELAQLRLPWCDVEVSTMQCGASPWISSGDCAMPFETVRTAMLSILAVGRALGKTCSNLRGVEMEHKQMSGERGRWSINR